MRVGGEDQNENQMSECGEGRKEQTRNKSEADLTRGVRREEAIRLSVTTVVRSLARRCELHVPILRVSRSVEMDTSDGADIISRLSPILRLALVNQRGLVKQ